MACSPRCGTRALNGGSTNGDGLARPTASGVPESGSIRAWISTGGRAGLVVDPGAHGRHRETDLAMLDLVDALPRLLGADGEVTPLAAAARSA